jgi:peroxiredoxin
MPETDDFPTGAAVGESVPDFTLPDQRGNAVTLSEVLRESRALVVFHRSARW